MPFTDLPFAEGGPEFPEAPTQPAPIPVGLLASARKRALGHAAYQIDPEIVCQLPGIPPGSQSAIVIAEAATDSIPAGRVLLRFWMDGTWPSVIAGLPMYDGQAYEIVGLDDLQNTRIISTDGNPHVLQIQYFSYL